MKYFWVFCFLIPFLGHSQNKQIVYDFANLPQTLLLNPGAEVTNKWHVGVPLVSHFSVNGGFSGFSTYDIFADNGVPINDKIKAAVNNFGKSEFVALNQQLEVISVGFELPNKSYVSFGYYEEFDLLAKIPERFKLVIESTTANIDAAKSELDKAQLAPVIKKFSDYVIDLNDGIAAATEQAKFDLLSITSGSGLLDAASKQKLNADLASAGTSKSGISQAYANEAMRADERRLALASSAQERVKLEYDIDINNIEIKKYK